MGNHIHLVCRVYPEDQVTDKEIQERYKQFYGEDKFIFARRDIDYYKKRWTSLSELVKDIKQDFTRYYNRKHGRKGYFWGERFTLLNSLRLFGNVLRLCPAK